MILKYFTFMLIVFVIRSLHTQYGRDSKFTVSFFVCFFLPGLTDQREIWLEVSPISQAGLLKFLGRYHKDGEIVAPFFFLGRHMEGYVIC